MTVLTKHDFLRAAKAADEFEMRMRRAAHRQPVGGLIEFMRDFWSVLEPGIDMVEGWCLYAMCQHLEAVTAGKITRLLINISPGSCKSLLVNVFWPAWEWGPMRRTDLRYISFSYSAHLTERDNERFREVIKSPLYQRMYGGEFTLTKDGATKIANDKTGWKFASSVGGVGTGERADRVLIDDPHNVKEAESDLVRTETVRWFRESAQNRLNDLLNSVIVVIMQRVNEYDVSGCIIEDYPDYVHLCIPIEYEDGRHCTTYIDGVQFWTDPRSEDGELAWPERYPEEVLAPFRQLDYLWAGQYQQRPEPRGGGILKRDYWKLWTPLAAAQNDVKPGCFPPFEYVLAVFDGAYTEKQENDPSALTVWGVWMQGVLGEEPRLGDPGNPKIMLIDAWQKRLTLHGRPEPVKWPGEDDRGYMIRKREAWGVIEWIAYTCRRHKVDKLLIESKATGITVYQEMKRLFARESFMVQLQDPGKLDKVARAYAVQHMFADGMIWRPEKDFAQMVEDQCASFPKGNHDDIVDTTTMGLTHLRRTGFAPRADESRATIEEFLFPSKPPPRRLYEV